MHAGTIDAQRRTPTADPEESGQLFPSVYRRLRFILNRGILANAQFYVPLSIQAPRPAWQPSATSPGQNRLVHLLGKRSTGGPNAGSAQGDTPDMTVHSQTYTIAASVRWRGSPRLQFHWKCHVNVNVSTSTRAKDWLAVDLSPLTNNETFTKTAILGPGSRLSVRNAQRIYLRIRPGRTPALSHRDTPVYLGEFSDCASIKTVPCTEQIVTELDWSPFLVTSYHREPRAEWPFEQLGIAKPWPGKR